MALTAWQGAIESFPDGILLYPLSSRYCPTEALADVAWHWFSNTDPGWSQVQAICDWINEHLRYGARSPPLTTAIDVYVACGGMCRDLAHMAITFCRALTIPARCVFGYMPHIGVTGPQPPMDFHAWFEAYLEGRWWTFDACFNTPRIGRIPIGYGRDAVDVAVVTTYGSASFQQMTVWSDLVTDEPGDQQPTSNRRIVPTRLKDSSELLTRQTTKGKKAFMTYSTGLKHRQSPIDHPVDSTSI